ncbi:MAG: DUF3142 domain-containing protein [Kiritimatiellaeota bacterium]|nr:DUF3142 domain-containing protein [Kiritimatiellota bacterium]
MRVVAFLVTASLATAAAESAGFYVWQRAWTQDVATAVKAAEKDGRPLYVLAGELEPVGSAYGESVGADLCVRPASWAWKRPNVPETIWQGGRATAVLRAPANAMNDAEALTETLRREMAALKTGRVQLDIDVAERRLADYAAVLGRLREAFPAAELSATLLPVHLAHTEMADVAKPLDYYVVQVHGIDPPRHRDEAYSLMRRDVALRAIERAKALGHPFKVALPTYAYVLTFDETGSFTRLYAEGFPGVAQGMEAQVAAPDFGLLSEVLATGAEAVWFRLPVAGDRWALDMETVHALENGDIPTADVEVTAERDGGTLTVYARFRHQIPLTGAIAELPWRETALRGEFFPLNGTRADAPHGTLPRTVTVAPHACGQRFPIAFAITQNEL